MIMKKVFLVVLSAMMMAATTIQAKGVSVAESDDVDYRLRLNLRDMRRSVSLEYDQIEVLAQTNETLSRRVEHLATIAPERRQALLEGFLFDNLAIVHSCLSSEQYRDYLAMLNTEFNRTGLNGILFGREEYLAAR